MTFTLPMWGNFAAMVSIYAQDGTVAVAHGGIEMGQGINTKVSLVGIDISKNMNASVKICTFISVRDRFISTHLYACMHACTCTHPRTHTTRYTHVRTYEGWNFNSGNYLFTADTKLIHVSKFYCPSM